MQVIDMREGDSQDDSSSMTEIRITDSISMILDKEASDSENIEIIDKDNGTSPIYIGTNDIDTIIKVLNYIKDNT